MKSSKAVTMDIKNQVINELTIKEIIPKPKKITKYKSWNTGIWVRCECSCGKKIDVPLYGVQKGLIKSCGHYRKIKAAETLKKIKEDNPTPNAVYLTFEGKTQNISEWSKETGIPRSTIMYRLSKEMPIEKVLERKCEDVLD